MLGSIGKQIFVVGAKRTPFGAYGGALKDLTTTDLAVVASTAALQQAAIDPAHVDHVIIGNVFPTQSDGAFLSRHVGLRVGIPQEVPGLTVNRLCGSGFQSIVTACHEILAGDAEVVLAGGAENMSQAPYVVRGIRFGTQLTKKYQFEDTVWEGLVDTYAKKPMGVTAEDLGTQYNVTREECDEFAHRSQNRWSLANNAGYFKNEMAPVKVKTRKGEAEVAVDEHPRLVPLEALQKLKPVFKPDGLVTAGNASGINDGAGAVVLATEEAVKKHHLNPLARIVGWQVVGVDPGIMGIGPGPAIKQLMKKTNMNLDQMDMIEVNEAFAAQAVAVQKELGIDGDRLNMNGGAIAIGHPVGGSGSRISAHITHELRRRKAKYGIGSACIGGGMGIAVLFESVL